jgi:uncharacterized membrane protein YphA (DoxX/SURF4 family)
MFGALVIVKIHTPTFVRREWLALWISLALAILGAGAYSLDALRYRPGRETEHSAR